MAREVVAETAQIWILSVAEIAFGDEPRRISPKQRSWEQGTFVDTRNVYGTRNVSGNKKRFWE